jgi:hypothetical protein
MGMKRMLKMKMTAYMITMKPKAAPNLLDLHPEHGSIP